MDLSKFEIVESPFSTNTKSTENGHKRIAFFGSSHNLNKCREEFFRLSTERFSDFFHDIGNIQSGVLADLESDFDSLRENKEVLPLFICTEAHRRICLPSMVKSTDAVCIVDKNSEKYEGEESYQVNQSILVGGQGHVISEELSDSQSVRDVRLGLLKTDPQMAEVVMRSSDVVIFHLDALRYGDNIGNDGSLTSGLTIEEACQLAKYAGASTHLKLIVIAGYDENKDVLNMMAKNVALLSYYIAEGFRIRQREDEGPESSISYTVVPENWDSELVFYKNRISGRWWVSVPSEFESEPVLIPCTHKDYEEACNNRISDRITSVFAHI